MTNQTATNPPAIVVLLSAELVAAMLVATAWVGAAVGVRLNSSLDVVVKLPLLTDVVLPGNVISVEL